MKSNRPWWWRNFPGLGQDSDDLAEDNEWENVLSNEQFLSTDRVDQELPNINDILDELGKDREDLRAVIPPLLQSSGLLLSISLGAIYFILNDGTRMGIHSSGIILFLFLAVGILAISIVSDVLALYKKPPADGVKKNERLEYERKNGRKDQRYALCSILTLIGAVTLIVIALVSLYLEYGNLSIDSNTSEERDPLVTVIGQCPNSSNYSHAYNYTPQNLQRLPRESYAKDFAGNVSANSDRPWTQSRS